MVGFLDKFKLCDAYDAVGNLHQVQSGSLRAVFMLYKVVDAPLYGFDIAHSV